LSFGTCGFESHPPYLALSEFLGMHHHCPSNKAQLRRTAPARSRVPGVL
jgi:hypothetical protein